MYIFCHWFQWRSIICKHNDWWHHMFELKASAFGTSRKKPSMWTKHISLYPRSILTSWEWRSLIDNCYYSIYATIYIPQFINIVHNYSIPVNCTYCREQINESTKTDVSSLAPHKNPINNNQGIISEYSPLDMRQDHTHRCLCKTGVCSESPVHKTHCSLTNDSTMTRKDLNHRHIIKPLVPKLVNERDDCSFLLLCIVENSIILALKSVVWHHRHLI
jgi:hypothetical protein